MEHLHPVFQDALHHEPSRVASENQTQSRRIATQIPKRLTHLTPGLFRQSDISTPQLSPPRSVNLSPLFQRVDPSSLSVKDSRRDEKQRRHKNQNIPFHHNIYLQYANILLYSINPPVPYRAPAGVMPLEVRCAHPVRLSPDTHSQGHGRPCPQRHHPRRGLSATWTFHDCSFQMNSPDGPSMIRVSMCSISEQVGMSIFG